MGTLTIECDTGKASDGYHTFDELYEHRCHLFVALMRSNPKISWRANNHEDGTMYEGWFVSGMHLPTGDISYHLPVAMWEMLDRCGIETTLRGPKWDGHTAADVVKRLGAWCGPNKAYMDVKYVGPNGGTWFDCPYTGWRDEVGGMRMAQYRKKPVVIEATQWFKDGDHARVMRAVKRPDGVIFCHDQIGDDGGEGYTRTFAIPTLEGAHEVTPGDWIIRGLKDELYPCKPDIFAATYEAEVGREEEECRKAYDLGWKTAANWMERNDLFADIGSMCYLADRERALRELAAAIEAMPNAGVTGAELAKRPH